MSAELVEWQIIDGATVRLGWFTRAQLFLARYADGRVAVEYQLDPGRIRVEVAGSPWQTT
jgi:hypothetical protein